MIGGDPAGNHEASLVGGDERSFGRKPTPMQGCLQGIYAHLFAAGND